MQRLILGIAAGAMVAIAAAAIFVLFREAPEPRPPSVVQARGAEIGGPFELTAHTGARVTAAEVIDGPTLVYFGYTFCPDVCPIDAYNMAAATELLETRGVDVTPVFITVDPARDDPEALSHWVDALHPKMIGLTGSDEDIAEAATAYKAVYQRVEAPESQIGYLMNHTAYIYFMLPDGLGALFRQGAEPEVIADEVERVLTVRGEIG